MSRSAFRVPILWASVMILGCLASGAARAADPARDALRWTPAMRFGFGVHSQGLDGNILSTDALPFIQGPSGVPDDPGTPANEGFDVSSPGSPGDSATTIEFRYGMRLYAPEDLLPIESSFRPRLFLSAGVEIPLDDGFVAARYDRDFSPSTIRSDFGNDRTLGEFCPPEAIQSCNYSARTTVDILANWSFGFGADFRLPVFEGQYHLVPFVEYFGQAYESQSTFSVKLSANLQSDETRRIEASSDTEILHGIAAGLGFEVDVYQGDWTSVRLFVETRAGWLLNDRETRYTGTNTTPTTNFNSGAFTARPSGFLVTTGGGIEIRWNHP